MRLAIFLFMLLLQAIVHHPINLNQTLIGYDGKEIHLTSDKDSPVATLKDICVVALETVTQEHDGPSLSALEKFKRDRLARRIYEASTIELTAEEISLVKERIGKVYGPYVVGAAWPLLDPAVLEDKK